MQNGTYDTYNFIFAPIFFSPISVAKLLGIRLRSLHVESTLLPPLLSFFLCVCVLCTWYDKSLACHIHTGTNGRALHSHMYVSVQLLYVRETFRMVVGYTPGKQQALRYYDRYSYSYVVLLRRTRSAYMYRQIVSDIFHISARVVSRVPFVSPSHSDQGAVRTLKSLRGVS